MAETRLISLTRGNALIDVGGTRYHVNGEGFADGTWDIFPQMVYRETDAGLERVASEEERRTVVESLCKHFDATGVTYLCDE